MSSYYQQHFIKFLFLVKKLFAKLANTLHAIYQI